MAKRCAVGEGKLQGNEEMISPAKKLCTTAVTGLRRIAVEGNIGNHISPHLPPSLRLAPYPLIVFPYHAPTFPYLAPSFPLAPYLTPKISSLLPIFLQAIILFPLSG